jgi:2-oxoglutarate ferredoxin oxidoreductase subunit alpha
MSETNGKRIAFLQGNEACAVAAIQAGVTFFAGYPITPSSEIAAVMALKLPQIGGFFAQMEDEIGAMGAIIGAAMTGQKTMTATSGPGFSLKQENIGYAALTEVPCIIVNVMRGGPSTGLPTELSQGDVQQARWGTHGDHPIIALAPSNVGETYEYTIKAVSLAERYRTPVIILLDEVLAHTRESVTMPPLDKIRTKVFQRVGPQVPPSDFKPYDTAYGDIPPMAAYGTGYRFHTTGLIHDENGFPTSTGSEITALLERLNRKIVSDDPELTFFREFYTSDMTELVISYGTAARVAKRVVATAQRAGRKIGMLQLITLWPSPDKELRKLLKKVKKVYVVEHNQGQYLREVERLAPEGVKVKLIKRIDGKLITPDEIREAL